MENQAPDSSTYHGHGHGIRTLGPHACTVHLALMVTQLSFGGGAIVGKFGIHGTNPVLFALLREGIAGPILFALSIWKTRTIFLPRGDLLRLFLAGVAIYSNQLFFILGLKLSDPVSGSAWQPSQPIFTMVLAVCAGYERATGRQVAGTLLAAAGAIFMVLVGPAKASQEAGEAQLLGHFLFALNCLGTSAYVVLAKPLVQRYAPILVVSWAYLSAAVMMLLSTCIINSVPELLNFVCLDAEASVRQACVANAWKVPPEMVLPICYWVMFNSILAYFLMTWANQHAKASVVSVYTVLQPVFAGLISFILIVVHGQAWGNKFGLQRPGFQDLGLLGIVLGLVIVFWVPSEAPPSAPPASSGRRGRIFSPRKKPSPEGVSSERDAERDGLRPSME